MRKAYITRYGAVGDFIHCSHIPRLLKEKAGFDYVAFEYNYKGKEVLLTNPYIDEHIHFDPSSMPSWPVSVLHKRWAEIKERGGFDLHLNLQLSIEHGFIAMETQNEYYRNDEYRRIKYGSHNYYDQSSIWSGHPEWCGEVGNIYFSDDEELKVKEFYDTKGKDKFVMITNLSGTSKHKIFYNAKDIITTFLGRHPDAICLTMGDKDCQENLEFDSDRVIRCANRCPYRQSMLMTKYCNLLIGAESGLMVAGTLLGAPTVQLMTAASIKNHGGDFNNDFSLQSPAKCSPCHKGPYDYIGCPTFDHLGIKYPACVKFNSDSILDQMERVYDNCRKSKKNSSANLSAV